MFPLQKTLGWSMNEGQPSPALAFARALYQRDPHRGHAVQFLLVSSQSPVLHLHPQAVSVRKDMEMVLGVEEEARPDSVFPTLESVLPDEGVCLTAPSSHALAVADKWVGKRGQYADLLSDRIYMTHSQPVPKPKEKCILWSENLPLTQAAEEMATCWAHTTQTVIPASDFAQMLSFSQAQLWREEGRTLGFSVHTPLAPGHSLLGQSCGEDLQMLNVLFNATAHAAQKTNPDAKGQHVLAACINADQLAHLWRMQRRGFKMEKSLSFSTLVLTRN